MRNFFKLESSAGILLGISAVLALILQNSPLSEWYELIVTTQFSISLGALGLSKPILLWVNDGLMAIFFLLVGLEVKREMLTGQLSSRAQLSLPIVAAMGGMIMPALIFYFINFNNPENLSGWAIPTATDIAFALAALSLAGKTVPQSLKISLATIAIIDDLGAIVIIACFYTASLSSLALLLAIACILVLTSLNLRGVNHLTPYLLVGFIMWLCVLKSGVHATLAGVVLAFFIPLKIKNAHGESLSCSLEKDLHPWVAFFILPLFAFVNSGVSLSDVGINQVFSPLTLGIFFGLCIGKPLGVLLFTLIGKLSGVCDLPKGINWLQFTGLAFFTGIGFTMSLFIGTLAFSAPEQLTNLRLGVVNASIVSATLGFLVMKYARHR